MGLFSRNRGNSSSSSSAQTEAVRKKNAFCAYLDSRGSYYDEVSSQPAMVKMNYGGGDFVFPHLTAWIDFDPPSNGKGDTVHIVIPQVARFTGSSRARGLDLCNKISMDKRWIRAYIDDDGDVMVDGDMYTTGGGDVSEDVRHLVATMMSVIDDVYEELQRAQWS